MEQPSATGSPVVFTPPPVAESAISYLLSVMINWGLFGVIIVQFYTYLRSFPNDAWNLRLTVYIVVLLETVQAILLSYHVLDTYGAHFGDFEGTSRIGVAWFAVPFLTAIISFMVHVYLILKIYHISELRVFPAILGFLAFIQTGSGIAVSIAGHIVDDFRQFTTVKSISVLGTLWVCVGAVVDISVAVCLAYQLYSLKGSERSEAVVWKLIRLFLETGSLTATLQIMGMVFFFAASGKPYHLIVANNLARLYAINLLVIQNSRIAVRAGLSRTGVPTSFSENLRAVPTRSSFATSRHSKLNPSDFDGSRHGSSRGGTGSDDLELPYYSNKPFYWNSVDTTYGSSGGPKTAPLGGFPP